MLFYEIPGHPKQLFSALDTESFRWQAEAPLATDVPFQLAAIGCKLTLALLHADVIRDPKVAKPASNDDSQLAVMESIQNNTRPLNTVISQSAPTVLVEPEKCTDTSRFVLVGLVQCNTQQLDDDSSHSVFYEPSENQPML